MSCSPFWSSILYIKSFRSSCEFHFYRQIRSDAIKTFLSGMLGTTLGKNLKTVMSVEPFSVVFHLSTDKITVIRSIVDKRSPLREGGDDDFGQTLSKHSGGANFNSAKWAFNCTESNNRDFNSLTKNLFLFSLKMHLKKIILLIISDVSFQMTI